MSTGDVRREITFCKKTGVRILGIIENMSGFVCPHCSVCTLSYLMIIISVIYSCAFELGTYNFIQCSQAVFNKYLSLQECSNIFSKGGGEELAKLTGSVFLGKSNEIEWRVIPSRNHKVSQRTRVSRHS